MITVNELQIELDILFLKLTTGRKKSNGIFHLILFSPLTK